MTTELVSAKIMVPTSVIRRQYAKGMTLPQLARLYETDVEALKPLVQGVEWKRRAESDEEDEWGFDEGADMVFKRIKPRHHIDHASYAEPVKRMIEEGMSNPEIMNELGITHTNLQTIKKKFGLKLTYADGGPRRVARRKRLAQAKEETT